MSRNDDLAVLIEHAPELSWLPEAACADLSVRRLELFFVDAGRTLSKEAVAICERCPVRVDCLRHAYDHEIAGGYFGGVSPAMRRRLTLDEAMAHLAPTAR